MFSAENEDKVTTKPPAELKLWYGQYWIGVFLIAFNVDILMPLLRLLKFSWLEIFFITWPVAVSELSAWWWFWGRFKNKIFPEILASTKEILVTSNKGQEGIGIWKNIKTHLEKKGLWFYFKLLVTEYFKKLFEAAVNKDNKTIREIKKRGHVGIFLIGASPLPAARTSLAIFCAVTRWRSGFATLLLSDVLHIALVIFGWKTLFNLLGNTN